MRIIIIALITPVWLLSFNAVELKAAEATKLTPRQELLKQLPKDTEELVIVDKGITATWSVTVSSGKPLEIIESIMVEENGIIKTTVWTLGQTLKSFLVVAITEAGPEPHIVAEIRNGEIEIKWQVRPFSVEETYAMLQFARELVQITLKAIGIEDDEALKKYAEKEYI